MSRERANAGAYIPTFGNTRSVTRALKRADGEFVKSIEELKRG